MGKCDHFLRGADGDNGDGNDGDVEDGEGDGVGEGDYSTRSTWTSRLATSM